MAVPLIILLAALIVIPFGIIALMYVVLPLFKALGWCCRQVGRFVIGEIGDTLRVVGAIITQVIFLPLIILNILIGRWSAAAHYGRAFQAELKTCGLCLYRIAIGHPARLLCLTALTDGLEKRLPEVVAAAPTADRPHSRTTGQFEGYTIIGSLPGGGSGGKLYVAEPDTMKRAIFERSGRPDIRQVVIKTFSLRDGSSLPQIVRESRALEAAKKLGLVLEHELSEDRFYYITEYVPGESLGLVTQRLHAMSGGDGLGESQLRTVLSVGADLLSTLDLYHRGGLWHKDVKPDNIIVDGKAAHLVDFGLVTPLRSGMTLTTHGTEYFRDPELVRLALKGVKVHQVDGAKFDVYAAGAVLFSMVENSFPAHGGLSQISRRCPEALRWIVRRAMTDYDKRYPTAASMLADLDVVRLARDPFAVKPIDLPSLRSAAAESEAAVLEEETPIRPAVAAFNVGDGSGTPGFASPGYAPPREEAPRPGSGPRQRPRLRVKDWWSGGYVVDHIAPRPPVPPAVPTPPRADDSGLIFKVMFGKSSPKPAWTPRNPGRSAKEQIENARARAHAARQRARDRMQLRRKTARGDYSTMNLGVGVAVVLFLGACLAFVAVLFSAAKRGGTVSVVTNYGDERTAASSYAFGDLPEIGAATSPGAPAEPTLVADASYRGPKVVINGVRVNGNVPPPVEPAPMLEGERVLVITDVIPSTPAINGAIERLAAAGFTVLGNYPGNPAEEPELQQQLDLEVQAKAVRGLGQLDAQDTSERLGRWLAEQDDLSLLVWFSRTDPTGKSVRFSIVTPQHNPGAGEAVKDEARLAMRAGMQALNSR